MLFFYNIAILPGYSLKINRTKYGPMRFLQSNRMSLNTTKRHGIHLNVVNIIELLLFSVINIFVFKYNLCEDIFNDVLVYLSNCSSVVETPSDSVCYGSIFRLYPGKIAIL